METILNFVNEYQACQNQIQVRIFGTHKDERTVLFKTISLDCIKPNTNPKTNSNPNTNPNTNTNPIQLFYALFEHRPLIFSLAEYFFRISNFRYSFNIPTCNLQCRTDVSVQRVIEQDYDAIVP